MNCTTVNSSHGRGSIKMSMLEDEWEYEYDTGSTEVFLIDLDLSTVNQAVRSTGANRHKRLNEVVSTSNSKKQKTSDRSNENANTPADGETSVVGTPTTELDQDTPTSQEHVPSKGLQILDLSSGNPIVAYGGEVFSCKWADMIGTTLFFAHPQNVPLYESELSTSDYDMIGSSRIKLVGTKTKLTPVQQSAITDHSVPAGQSLGTIRRNNAKVNADLRKQASFLEQLMNIKRDRGENDNVFVAMNDNIATAATAGKLNGIAQAQVQNLENLNREAVKGSADALQKIEQIYLSQNVNDIDERVTSLPSNNSKPRTRQRISRRPRVLGTASPSPEPTDSTLVASLHQDLDTNKG